MSARPLLVGELNPHAADPQWALYPTPRGATGDRLRRVMLLSDQEYLANYDRVNLCVGRWSSAEARRKAALLLMSSPQPSAYVLLGRRVCDAFGFGWVPFTRSLLGGQLPVVVVLPHPSGRSRLWNAPDAARRSREALWSAGCVVGPVGGEP